jgi:hypothetical protein
MDGTRGLPKNTVCAKIFMKAAAKQGYVKAIEALKLLNACEACGAPDASRKCMGCLSCTDIGVVRYCTPECQEKHWKPAPQERLRRPQGLRLPPLRERPRREQHHCGGGVLEAGTL